MSGARTVRTISLEDAVEAIIDYRGKTPEKSDSGVLLVTAKVIKDGFIQRDENEYIAEDTYDAWMRRGLPRVGDVLITTEAPLGQIARLDESNVALAQRVILLRSNPSIITPSYLYHLMQGPDVQNELLKRATGTTVAGIKQSELRKVPLRVPGLGEQQCVGTFLDAICRLIENTMRRVRVLTRTASELYAKYHNSSTSWTVKTVAALSEQVDYGYTAAAESSEVGPHLLRITDIAKDSINWQEVPHCVIDEKRIPRFSLRGGDIVVARSGASVGSAKRIHERVPRSVFASYLVRFRPQSNVSSYWLGIAVESEEYRKYVLGRATGTAQPNANARVLGSFSLRVPPSSIQDEFDDLVRPIFDTRQVLEERNAILRRLRYLLLPKLLSGEIDVSRLPLPQEAP